jgi:hypothetical protein
MPNLQVKKAMYKYLQLWFYELWHCIVLSGDISALEKKAASTFSPEELQIV